MYTLIRKDHSCVYTVPIPSEPSNEQLLQRINYVAALLERSERSELSAQGVSPHSQSSTHIVQLPRNPTDTEVESPALEFGSCERLLAWRCLAGCVPETTTCCLWLPDPVTAGEPSHWLSRSSPVTFSSSTIRDRGVIDSSKAPTLVEHYAVNLYPKNPILDIRELENEAVTLAQSGWQWDGKSCRMVSPLNTIVKDDSLC